MVMSRKSKTQSQQTAGNIRTYFFRERKKQSEKVGEELATPSKMADVTEDMDFMDGVDEQQKGQPRAERNAAPEKNIDSSAAKTPDSDTEKNTEQNGGIWAYNGPARGDGPAQAAAAIQEGDHGTEPANNVVDNSQVAENKEDQVEENATEEEEEAWETKVARVLKQIETSHPIGRRGDQLIVRFYSRPYRNNILKESKKRLPRGKNSLRIIEDLTQADYELKKKARPLMQKAYEEGKPCRFRNGKLIIDGFTVPLKYGTE